MLKLIAIFGLLCSLTQAQADSSGRLFQRHLEAALREHLDQVASAVIVRDLKLEQIQSREPGAITDKHWVLVSNREFREVFGAIKDGDFEWVPSNVSALAEKGSSLMLFLDKDGGALFGLMHQNRWESGQYEIAIVSGSAKDGFYIDGGVRISIIDRAREFVRDRPYVIDFSVKKSGQPKTLKEGP